jgi:glycosyltransferase involved in cell wall biosynthesis
MKEVLIDMHRLKNNPYNGLYIFSCELGKALAAIKDEKINLHFYLPKKFFGFFGEQFQYTTHRSRDKFFMWGTRKYDVWHITTQISWYRPFNRKTKVVYTIHDLNFLIEEKENVKRNQRLLKNIQNKINRADFITCISKYTLSTVQEHLQLGNKPTAVIYNGCNITTYPYYDKPVYRPVKSFLFSLGLVEPRKNLHTLPPLLLDNDYELIIGGLNHHPYSKEVIAAAERYGVGNRIKLTGAISEEDKYWYYKNCEAFLFPSYAEGFGLPVIEAMHYGKPVFISSETCMPEIGGDAAYYFDSFEPGPMRKLFIEGMYHYQRTQPQQQIKERAALFSWHRAAEQYIAIYKSLL